MVVFGTQMEIAQQYGCLGACDDENPKDQEQKSKHVVHLAGPQRIQYEEQLNENASKWQHTAHNDARNGLRVNRLVWNLTWNLICTNGMLQRLQKERMKNSDKKYIGSRSRRRIRYLLVF